MTLIGNFYTVLAFQNKIFPQILLERLSYTLLRDTVYEGRRDQNQQIQWLNNSNMAYINSDHKSVEKKITKS